MAVVLALASSAASCDQPENTLDAVQADCSQSLQHSGTLPAEDHGDGIVSSQTGGLVFDRYFSDLIVQDCKAGMSLDVTLKHDTLDETNSKPFETIDLWHEEANVTRQSVIKQIEIVAQAPGASRIEMLRQELNSLGIQSKEPRFNEAKTCGCKLHYGLFSRFLQ